MPQRLTATIVTIAAVIAFLVVGKSLLVPFAIALIIWYIIDAIALKIRGLSIFGIQPFQHVSVLLALVVVILLISGMVQMIGDTVEQVKVAAPNYQDNVTKILERFAALTGVEVAPAIAHWANNLDLGGIIGSFAAAIMGLAGNAGLVAIYVVFLLLEERYFGIKLRIMFADADRRKKVTQMLDAIQLQIRQYVYIKTMVSALTGILSYAVLLWVGVDYAPFWALLIFMLNYIPTIGSLIAVLLPTALSLVQFDTFGPFLTLLVSLGTLQVLIGNVLEPRLMGSSLNLSPLVVILALSFWGQMWGVTGMFLSVPITVISMIILANFPQTRAIAVAMSENGRLKLST
ncbi:AI-2E family transporter [Thiolapillus sp.]